MHDGRLLTLDDTVEFFNLVLGTKLTGEEKHDLVVPSYPMTFPSLQLSDHGRRPRSLSLGLARALRLAAGASI
jgi:hypothetical protein